MVMMCYDVQYNMIPHISHQWLEQNINQLQTAKHTPYLSHVSKLGVGGGDGVNEWLILKTFLVESEVHMSCVITAYTLESLSSLT